MALEQEAEAIKHLNQVLRLVDEEILRSRQAKEKARDITIGAYAFSVQMAYSKYLCSKGSMA